RDDEARFEDDKTDLLHVCTGKLDYSAFGVRFGNHTIMPSASVKWVGVILDKNLSGLDHIHARAVSASRALNATIAVMHRSWGMRPQLVRDLARATVLPCADYGVSLFLPLPESAFKPLDKVNKSVVRCITGSFRTASQAAMEKESAILPP
ncbi:hypothetical protein K438DRAFT_1423614, partial [Mycena galopus ATCC 62051]